MNKAKKNSMFLKSMFHASNNKLKNSLKSSFPRPSLFGNNNNNNVRKHLDMGGIGPRNSGHAHRNRGGGYNNPHLFAAAASSSSASFTVKDPEVSQLANRRLDTTPAYSPNGMPGEEARKGLYYQR